MLIRDEIKAVLETILFTRGEKISLSELSEITELSPRDIKDILQEMIIEYNERKRGIQIVAINNNYTMCTKPQYSDILSKMLKPSPKRLSYPALETLAIIAYKQPVSRAEIEKIRGVKSDKIILSLLEKKLILEVGKKDLPLRATVFGTSDEFLKSFGLSSLEDLPGIKED